MKMTIEKRNGKWVVLDDEGRTLGTRPSSGMAAKLKNELEVTKPERPFKSRRSPKFRGD